MKMKYMWIPFVLALGVAVPLHMYQMKNLVETDTGLFVAGSGYSMILLLAIFAVFVLLLIIMSGLCKDVPKQYRIKKNIFAGIFGLAGSILLLLDSAQNLLGYVSAGDNKKMLVMSAASVLAAVGFIFMAVSSFSGKNILAGVPILALFTTIWGCTRLILTFLQYTNIVSSGENMLHMLSIIFILLFFFSQAKLLANLEGDKTLRRTITVGFSAIVSIAVFNIPHMLMQLAVNRQSFVFSEQLPYITDLVLLCYIFCVLVEMTVTLDSTSSLEMEPEAEQEDDRLPEYSTKLTEVQKHEELNRKPKAQYFDSLVNDDGNYRRAADYPYAEGAHAAESVTQQSNPSDKKAAEQAAETKPAENVQPAAGRAEETGNTEETSADLEKIDELIAEISRQNKK